MDILSVSNQKGGVGKTTIDIHLAIRAAEQGKRVLIVDFDEGDVSQVFPEVAETDEKNYIQSSQLFDGSYVGGIPRQVAPNLWLIEADLAILDVDDMPLEAMYGPRDALATFADQFDLCIIDTPPNLQRRMLGALVASDAVVTPFNISRFTLARIPKLLNTIESIREVNPNLRLLGFA
ncbi:ParA family protein [Pseudomonas asuensis]